MTCTCKSVIAVLVIFALNLKSINSNLTDLPKITTAIIRDSVVNVTYNDDMEPWSDVQKLIENAYEKYPPICVRGSWLIYKKPELETSTANDVHVFSGNNNCLKRIQIKEVGSMQPIGPYKFHNNSITLFEKKYFGSYGLSYFPDPSTKVQKFRKSWLPTLHSLITFGNMNWTLIDFSGNAVCVLPPADASHDSICLAPSLAKYKLPKGIKFVGVVQDCAKHLQIGTIKLTDCKKFGSKNKTMENVHDDTKAQGRAAASTSECPTSETDKIPLKEDIIRKLTKLRFTHDFSSNEQLLWPERKEDIWKTELMDTAFDIMISTCPEDVVPTSYLQLIRELTMYNLDKAWKSSKTNLTIPTKDIDKMAMDMNKCLGQARENMPELQDRVLQHYTSIRTPQEIITEIYTAFYPNPNFDMVIDSAWIVANYALGLCHHLTNYEIDYWAEYINMFRELYFSPMMSRWQSPKELSSKAYGAILGGFGTDIQFKRMGFCASIVFDFTPNMVPFEKNYIQ